MPEGSLRRARGGLPQHRPRGGAAASNASARAVLIMLGTLPRNPPQVATVCSHPLAVTEPEETGMICGLEAEVLLSPQGPLETCSLLVSSTSEHAELGLLPPGPVGMQSVTDRGAIEIDGALQASEDSTHGSRTSQYLSVGHFGLHSNSSRTKLFVCGCDCPLARRRVWQG